MIIESLDLGGPDLRILELLRSGGLESRSTDFESEMV